MWNLKSKGITRTYCGRQASRKRNVSTFVVLPTTTHLLPSAILAFHKSPANHIVVFEVINAHNESICSGLYRNSIDDYDDPQDAKKIAKLCKKTHRYDFDCVMRERYANLTWAEVTALYSRKLDSKQSRVPDQGMTTGMKVTAVDWVQVCDQVAQILDLTVDQMHSALWYYTDGATAHGLIKSTIMGGQCDLLALKMLKDKPVLMKLYQGPLGKPEHVDMHRRIDLLQKHFFSYITETDYLVKPELQGWAQEKSDDKYSFFRMRRKEIAKAAAEKDYEEERTRDEEWLESVLSSSDEGLEVRDVEGIQ